MPVNGTIISEANFLRTCLRDKGMDGGQVIQSQTGTGLFGDHSPDDLVVMLSRLRTQLKGLQKATVVDFVAKNKHTHSVPPRLTRNNHLICLDGKKSERLFRDNKGWERFRERYPESRGILEFSRVGFNPGLTQALVYLGMQFHWTVGEGGFWLYTRLKRRWVEMAHVTTWVS